MMGLLSVKCNIHFNMKKGFCKLLLFLILPLILTGCINADNGVENKIDKNVEEKTKIEEIYVDDEAINLFLNKYNEINDNKITKEMVSKKTIKGDTKDDVVSISNDKFEINVYDNYESNNEYSMSVYVGYTKMEATIDDYKEQFTNFIRVFDETLSSDEINNYWEDMISTYHSSYEINDIDITTYTNNGTVSYFKFTKKLKF